MKKRYTGNWVIVLIVLVNLLLWLVFPPENDGRDQYTRQVLSEMLSSSGVALFTCSLLLSLRLRWMEPYFGGLDKMYKAHKTSALTGLILILAHFYTMPGSGEVNLGRDLGKIALLGMLVLVALTLAPRIPFIGGNIQLSYHHWRWTHKFVGVFFITGMLHTLSVKNLLQFAEIPALYWKIIAYTGAAAYVYKEIVSPVMRRGHAYTVQKMRQLNGSTVELTLAPQGEQLKPRAGQFVFISFPQERDLREAHPFTVSSAPGEEELRLSIKASGDWTRRLTKGVPIDAAARLEGPHGMFDYKAGGAKQLWVAGGIGITPFLSWVREFQANPSQQIDMFYTVRGSEDALFWDEIAEASGRYPNFKARLNLSAKHGSLTAFRMAEMAGEGLADRHVYLCGPQSMVLALQEQLTGLGVPAGNIYFEEFNFR